MPDREKAINCLTDIEQIMTARQDICPREELQYWIELQEGVADALAMLKEQEAVYPSWQNGKMYCGHCGSKFPPRVMMRFCHRCGVPIKLKVNDTVEQEGR